MALMTCPECNGKVSTEAAACPHCGYPIYKMLLNQLEFKGKKYDITNIIELLDQGKKSMARIEILDMIHPALDKDEEKSLEEYSNVRKEIFANYRKYKGPIPGEETEQQPVAKCPTCGSTNIEVIGAGTRLMAGAMFGLASKTSRSQFRCKNCGYQW